MRLLLDAMEARVLGVLLEKKLTTPDQYPLSLNALTLGSNQKSNREPVLALEEGMVLVAVDSLRTKGLVMKTDSARVRKYSHLMREKYFFKSAEEALLAVLLLRGPQTINELRARSDSLYSFKDAQEFDDTVAALQTGKPSMFHKDELNAMLTRLPVLPGQKEPRFTHLLMGEPDLDALAQASSRHPSGNSASEELATLRQELATLRADHQALRAEFDAFKAQFG